MFTKLSYSKTLFFKLSRISLKPINAHRFSYEFVRYKSDEFIGRHIGPRENDKKIMLESIGYKVYEFCIIIITIIIIIIIIFNLFQNIEEFIAATIPANIRLNREVRLAESMSEIDVLKRLKDIGELNLIKWKSFIGMGYYNSFTPTPILRNIFENPGKWRLSFNIK